VRQTPFAAEFSSPAIYQDRRCGAGKARPRLMTGMRAHLLRPALMGKIWRGPAARTTLDRAPFTAF